MQINYAKIAVKHIECLDKVTKQRIKNSIEKLPFGDIKNFRVLFCLENDIITIKDVLPRGQAYKRI